MDRFTTHNAVLWGIGIMTAFLAMYYILGQEIPRQLANIILLGIATAISIGYFPSAQKAVKEGVSSGRQLIIVTIWLSWTGLFIQRIYTITNEALERPDWLANSPGSIIVAVLILISGLYAVIAPISDPDVLTREKVWDKAAITIGTLVSIIAALGYYWAGRS